MYIVPALPCVHRLASLDLPSDALLALLVLVVLPSCVRAPCHFLLWPCPRRLVLSSSPCLVFLPCPSSFASCLRLALPCFSLALPIGLVLGLRRLFICHTCASARLGPARRQAPCFRPCLAFRRFTSSYIHLPFTHRLHHTMALPCQFIMLRPCLALSLPLPLARALPCTFIALPLSPSLPALLHRRRRPCHRLLSSRPCRQQRALPCLGLLLNLNTRPPRPGRTARPPYLHHLPSCLHRFLSCPCQTLPKPSCPPWLSSPCPDALPGLSCSPWPSSYMPCLRAIVVVTSSFGSSSALPCLAHILLQTSEPCLARRRRLAPCLACISLAFGLLLLLQGFWPCLVFFWPCLDFWLPSSSCLQPPRTSSDLAQPALPSSCPCLALSSASQPCTRPALQTALPAHTNVRSLSCPCRLSSCHRPCAHRLAPSYRRSSAQSFCRWLCRLAIGFRIHVTAALSRLRLAHRQYALRRDILALPCLALPLSPSCPTCHHALSALRHASSSSTPSRRRSSTSCLRLHHGPTSSGLPLPCLAHPSSAHLSSSNSSSLPFNRSAALSALLSYLPCPCHLRQPSCLPSPASWLAICLACLALHIHLPFVHS